MNHKKIKRETLDWVNEVRTRNSLDALLSLPKGEKSSVCRCPVGRGLQGWAGPWQWGCGGSPTSDPTVSNHGPDLETGNTPRRVSHFIEEFDKGSFPELVA